MYSGVALQDTTYQHEIDNTLFIDIGTKVLVVTAGKSPKLVNTYCVQNGYLELTFQFRDECKEYWSHHRNGIHQTCIPPCKTSDSTGGIASLHGARS